MNREILGQKFLDTIERHIRKCRRNDTALRSTFLGGEKLFVENETAFQPFAEHHFIHRDIVQQPVVADVVEASFDVALHNPLRGWLFGQVDIALVYGVARASFLTETVRMVIRSSFCNGV